MSNSTNDNDSDTDDFGTGRNRKQPTISRRIVREPQNGNPGKAGVGVAYDSGGRDGERFRIEQLWPDGEAEPIYVHEADALELARTIIEHYEWEVEA